LVGTLASTVREVFPRLEVIPGAEIMLVAGGPSADLDLDVGRLGERLRDRSLESSELIPEMIPLFLDPKRAATLSESIQSHAGVNTIAHPRAVMLAGGLHEGRAYPPLLDFVLALERGGSRPLVVALVIGIFCLLAITFSRHPPVSTTAAVVGFSSMGWWLLLIASWQATRGSVYSEIGALTAIFMAGLAGGAGAATAWSDPARRLAPILASGGVLSLLIAGGFAIRFPLAGVPLMLGIGGALTGAAFPALTALSGGSARHSAGIVFAADELGAAAGALVVGIFAMTWAGLTATAWGLAALQLAAIPSVLMTLRRG